MSLLPLKNGSFERSQTELRVPAPKRKRVGTLRRNPEVGTHLDRREKGQVLRLITVIYEDHIAAMVAREYRNLHFFVVRAKSWLHASPIAKRLINSLGVFRLIESGRHVGKVMFDGISAQESFARAE